MPPPWPARHTGVPYRNAMALGPLLRRGFGPLGQVLSGSGATSLEPRKEGDVPRGAKQRGRAFDISSTLPSGATLCFKKIGSDG